MKTWPHVDFERLIDEVRQPRYGRADLTILGGRCAERNLLYFLGQWPTLPEMPFRVWEYVSEIVFERDNSPQNIALLERGRLFGPGGDLAARREGTAFNWHFIGPSGAKAPDDHGGRDYWQLHPDATLFRREETALLWGRRENGHWADDRVGAAVLQYPFEGYRLQLHFTTFSCAGKAEFVWYTGLSEWKEADNA
ncbi:MAG: hypothetical protein M0Z41_14140 [Peptococcaceae bacterium]|jgi:hypothetical protein|nr:hypothetical protein [Peptococcaceae bacterium]